MQKVVLRDIQDEEKSVGFRVQLFVSNVWMYVLAKQLVLADSGVGKRPLRPFV